MLLLLFDPKIKIFAFHASKFISLVFGTFVWLGARWFFSRFSRQQQKMAQLSRQGEKTSHANSEGLWRDGMTRMG
jgi:hypothetical protein